MLAPSMATPKNDASQNTRPSGCAVSVLVIVAAAALGAVFVDWSTGWGAGVLTFVTGEESADGATEAPGGGGASGYRFPVTALEMKPGRVVESVDLVGDVVSLRWARLAFQRSGRVSQALARLGDQVTADQPLARLDDRVLEKQLAVSQAAAQAALALAKNADREAKRGNDVGDDILSASERDRRNAEAEVADHRAEQAAAEASRLSVELEQGVLTAPFDGVVTRSEVTDGSYAAAGVTAFVVMDLENRQVLLETPASVAAGLSLGTEVTLTSDTAPDLSITAHLDKLVPAADFGTRNFQAIVDLGPLDPERQLLPGMFVRARFVRRAVDADFVVPTDAVQGVDDATWIVVARGGSQGSGGGSGGDPGGAPGGDPPLATFVPVRVLARNSTTTAIAPVEPGALNPGETVVVTGADNVFPGAPLRPVPHHSIVTGATTP